MDESPVDHVVESLEEIIDECTYIQQVGDAASKAWLRMKFADLAGDLRALRDEACCLSLIAE